MPYHYSRRLGQNLKAKFEFFRFRFHFRALDAVHFPRGKSGNVIRGALGLILRDTASPAAYARLFEPGSQLGRAPSGLGDWPRPFILRAGELDGRTVPEGGQFCFDVHIFDLRPAVLAYFHEAFAQFGGRGIGPGHGRVTLEHTEQVGLDDRAGPLDGAPPLEVELEPHEHPAGRVDLRFLSPTGICDFIRPPARPHRHAAGVVRRGPSGDRFPRDGGTGGNRADEPLRRPVGEGRAKIGPDRADTSLGGIHRVRRI
jgi:hypothetical protein